MPDKDFSKPHLYENYVNMVSAVELQSRQSASIHEYTYSATTLVFDS